MLAVVTNSGAGLAAGTSHPAVAVWFALGAAGLAAAVVAMAWSVQARQIRLAELLARARFLGMAEPGGGGGGRGGWGPGLGAARRADPGGRAAGPPPVPGDRGNGRGGSRAGRGRRPGAGGRGRRPGAGGAAGRDRRAGQRGHRRAGPLPGPFGWTAAGGVVGRRRGFGVAVS